MMNPRSPAAMFREGTIPVVRLSLCTMMQKMVPIKAPDARERICAAKLRLSAAAAQQARHSIWKNPLSRHRKM